MPPQKLDWIYKQRTRQGSNFNAFLAHHIDRHPFWFYGLPFLSLMVVGSWLLTGFTRIRYERHDRKVHEVTQREKMGMEATTKKPFDIREHYDKIANADLHNWEQRRVERLEGESENVF